MNYGHVRRRVNTTLVLTGYSFIDDLISEIKKALVAYNPILEAFNIFSMETQPEKYGGEQMHIICSHYGNNINDVYQDDSTPAESIIQRLNKKLNLKISFVLLMQSSKN